MDDISNYANKGYLSISGIVDNAPRIKDEKISFPLRVEQVRRGKMAYGASGVLYIFVRGKGAEINYGDKIEARGILSELQSFSNPLMLEGAKGYSLRATFYEKLPGGGGSPLKKAALWFSQRFNEVLIKILPQKEATLLGSVLLGAAVSPLSDDVKDDYRKAGLIHLLVVSGTQVSILIGVCLGITRAANLPLWVAILITSFFNLVLTVVTGAGSSILRAAIMGEITLVGLLFEKEKEFYTALAISALILLIIDPLNLFDVGFQLSFAATWALVYIAPVLRDCLVNHGTAKMAANLVSISLSPILATSPIIAFYFSQISLGAVVSNLLVLPWVEFLVILGFSTTVLGFIFLPLAQVLGGTIWLMLTILDGIAKLISSLPGACFYIKAPSVVSILGYYIGLILLVGILRREGRLKFTIKRLAFVVILFISIFLWNQVPSASVFGGKELIVTFLDVGQGDCALVEIPDGKKILIDGGGVDRRENMRGSGDQDREIGKLGYLGDKVGEKVVVPFLHRKGINQLDLVVLTHPHADHVGGLNKVLEEIKVEQVLDSGQVYESQAYKRFKALIDANKIKYAIGRAGQIIRFAEDVVGYILNPFEPLLENTNSDSIVMRLVYRDISFLFTGDVEKEGEERILQSSVHSLQSTVLKVGHHGSRTSTSDEFLKAVTPRVAVISVGKHNRYRHPHHSTLQKLKGSGVKVYRTDEDGAITVRTDGERLDINVTRGR